MLSLRLAEDDFLILRWFIPVLPRRILPVPVDSNRFAAVLHVFSFGTIYTSLSHSPRGSRRSTHFSTIGARIIVIVLPSIDAGFSIVPTFSSFTTFAIFWS